MTSDQGMRTPPPKPPELALQIGCDVARRVEFDLEPIRIQLRARMREPSCEYIWEQAERIATEAISALWSRELEDECARALADVHDEYLLDAARCLEAATAFELEGRRSWLARGVVHQFAFNAAFDVLAEDDESGEEAFI
jgi:hypothetical protein